MMSRDSVLDMVVVLNCCFGVVCEGGSWGGVRSTYKALGIESSAGPFKSESQR